MFVYVNKTGSIGKRLQNRVWLLGWSDVQKIILRKRENSKQIQKDQIKNIFCF